MPSLDDLVAQLQPQTNALPSSMVSSPLTALPTATGGGRTPGPLLANQPSNFTKLTNKWQELGPYAQQMGGADIISSLIDYDAERVARGGQPLTREQTVKAAVSARDNQMVTKPADRGIGPTSLAKNAIGDLNTIIHSIPRLPFALAGEVKALPTFASSVSAAQAKGANPIEALAQAPGLRMLPGAFIAQNLTHPAEYLRHPLFTGLDLLPAAKGIAASTPLAREAARVAEEAGTESNALRAVATNRLAADGHTIIRNPLGVAVDAFMQNTRPGQFLAQTFGKDARALAVRANEEGAKIAAVRDHLTPTDPNTYGRLLQDVTTIAKRYDLSPEEVTHAGIVGQLPDRMSELSGKQLAFIAEVRQQTEGQAWRLDAEGDLGHVQFPHGTEFYTPDIAKDINRARTKASAYSRIADIRTEMLHPTGNLSLDDIQRGLETASEMEAVSPTLAKVETRAIIHVLDGYGYDTEALRKSIRGKGKPSAALDLFKSTRDSLTQTPVMSLSEIVTELKRHKSDIMADRLTRAIADGNTPAITQALDALQNRQVYRLPVSDDARFVQSVRSLRKRLELDNSTLSKFTPKRAEQMAKRAETLIDRNAPARFQPLIGERARARYTEGIMPKSATPEQAADITRAVLEYDWPEQARLTGIDADQLKALANDTVSDVSKTWREMQSQGIDPVFVHKTTRGRASALASPRVGAVPVTQTQAQRRFTDWGNLESDVTVSLGHQAYEMLNRQGTEDFIDHVVQKVGIDAQTIRTEYAQRAREIAATQGMSFEQALSDLTDRKYERFNPDEAGYTWGGSRLDKYRGDNVVMIPKGLADNLRKMAAPKGPVTALFDPISKTFRYAVIGVSPRTHLYNILGGAVMLGGETGARGFANLQRAWEMVSHPETITDETLRATIGSAKRSWTDEEFARAQVGVRGGRTMARLLQESGTVKTADGLIQKSLEFNSKIDDMYRVAAYLSGHDKAMAKGMGVEARELAGRELMRKTMMDWTGMTPIERNIFKSVFPFYGFMRHSLGYVSRYPMDHPLRASTVAAFGRAEEQDLGALPGSFLSQLFVGKDDANRNAISVGGANPFNDVGNLFTVAGFLSATNPAISTVLEQAGLVQGKAELYPTLRYDPESGRMTAQHSNPLLAFAENTVPQTAILAGLLGINQQYNEQLATNPAAARRSMASAAGLPIVWRNYNVPAEIAKSEVARQKSEDAAKVAALESGDWTEAMRYPGLRPYFDTLSQLPPEVLAAYQPQTKEAIVNQMQLLVGPGGAATGGGQGQVRGGGM